MEVPQLQHTWPVSISNESGHVTQHPLPSRSTLCDNAYKQGGLLIDAPQLSDSVRAITPQSATPKAVDDDTLYSCNIIAQLQGSYEMATSSGHVQVSVILPNVLGQVKQWALAYRISGDGKALHHQYIHDEPSWFTLKSVTGKLEGVLRKGSNMKHTVEWWNSNDGSCIIWRRKGKVTFNIVQVEPKVRRNSIGSVRTFSTSPIAAHSSNTPMLGREENLFLNRAELLQQTTPAYLGDSSTGCFSPAGSFQSTLNSLVLSGLSVTSDQQQEDMFEVIKAHCSKNPLLFKKVIDWGVRNNPAHRVSEVTASLSKGRVWVTAHTVGSGEGEVPMDSLDDIKGAYQEVSTGVYMQPDPEACGSDVQHRMCKDEHGRWIIERHGLEGESWQMRAQQLGDGRWVDLRNTKVAIRVNIIAMSKILDTLGEELLASKNNLKKSMDFLFTSCNQLKLVKLKGRNLKHHIANLKVKLEKRYALSFGVQIASTAETIIQE